MGFPAPTANVDVTISGNDVDKNGYAGIVVSNWGGTATLDVVLEDQMIEDGGNGFLYYAGHGDNSANTDHVTIDNVTFSKNKENGLVIWLDQGATNVDVSVMDCLFEQNGDNGIQFLNSGFFGVSTVDLQNLTIVENEGNGIAIDHFMAPYMDGGGNMIHPVSNLDLTLNASTVKANSGWGIAESLNCIEDPAGGMAPPWNWNGPTRNTLWYNETISDSEILENNGGGWTVTSSEDVGWSHPRSTSHPTTTSGEAVAGPSTRSTSRNHAS